MDRQEAARRRALTLTLTLTLTLNLTLTLTLSLTLTLTRRDDEHDAYIVVSFVNATLVLSIGETVEEVTDSGLKPDTPTLHTSLLGEDAIVQAEM